MGGFGSWAGGPSLRGTRKGRPLFRIPARNKSDTSAVPTSVDGTNRKRMSGFLGCALLLTLPLACGERPEVAAKTAVVTPVPLSLEAAAIAAHEGPSVLGVPRYPNAKRATGLRETMLEAWTRAGEPPELFEVRLGERILVTDDAFERVKAFYRGFASAVFMDHEMEMDTGRQKMFTGIMRTPDGALVKFTLTRPFFRYPDQRVVDRTVIQMGRVGAAR